MSTLEVVAGPRQPAYRVVIQDGQAVILEDGVPITTGQSLTFAQAVKAAVRITLYRFRMVGTLETWPRPYPLDIAIHTVPGRLRVLRIPPAPKTPRAWS